MAYDKIVDSAKLDGAMTATADAIRGKTGKTADIPWDESTGFASEIASITTETEPNLQAKTATPSTSAQTIKPDNGYDGLSQVTVDAMPTATQATPSIAVTTGGLITASATQTAGYVAAGTKSATKQLTTQAAKTITPSTSNQTAVASGRYTTGAVTVKGDANLKAANIAKGVSIFGVAGSLEAGSKVATGTFTAVYDGAPSASVTGIGFKPTRVAIYVAGSFTDEQIENDNVIHVPLCATYNIELPNGTRVHYVSREFFEDDDGEQWDMPSVPSDDNWWNIKPTDDGFTITHDSMYHGMSDITYGYVAIG